MSTRHAVFTGAALVGAATAATSSVSLYRLAEQCAITGALAASLPIALDGAATVGALAWITEKGPVRVWGRAIAIGALVLSLGGNALEHAIAASFLAANLGVVLVVGATIPTSLWAVVHLAALMATPAKVVNKSAPNKLGDNRAARTKTPPAAPKVATPRRPVAVPTPLDGRRSGRSEMAAWLASQEPRSFSDEVDAVRTQFGCSFSTAKRVRADVRRATA